MVSIKLHGKTHVQIDSLFTCIRQKTCFVEISERNWSIANTVVILKSVRVIHSKEGPAGERRELL